MSLMSMGITAANVKKAVDRVKDGGELGTHNTPAKNTYILCPVDQTSWNLFWDLKLIVSIILEGVYPSVKPGWVTQRYEPDLRKLEFPIIKFHVQKERKLGIRGFDDRELHGNHTLIWPDGTKIKNGLWPGETVSNALGTATRQVLTKRFVRNPDLIKKILKDANGYCSACEKRAFRKPSGDWFLEVHHMKWLRDGGADAEANMIALCPNCHRQEHHGAYRQYPEADRPAPD